MELKVLKALWGMEGELAAQLARIAGDGYDGIEAPLPEEHKRGEFRNLLDQHKLLLVGMAFTGGTDSAEHARSLEEQVKAIRDSGAIKVTAHTARDSFSWDEQQRFYEAAAKIEERVGIEIGHETHRGRAMFTPWTTAAILRAFPTIKLCSDFSHWCVVAESLLHDQEENLRLAILRTIHIHGRVGYEEGPQVSDPRAPEYAGHVARHEGWWDAMIAAMKASGRNVATFTPEFGPPGYLHTLPYTQQPVANLYDICLWMAKRFRARVG